MEEVEKANYDAINRKEEDRKKEKDFENEIAAYNKEKIRKEEEKAAEAARLREEKEKEIQRLREL